MQLEATEIHFHELVYIIYIFTIVALTFESVDETLACDHSNESC